MERTTTDFFNKEYRDYAVYVVQNRAIPSCIDGFKPTHRKIIYTADKIWKNGNNKPLKLFQFAGRIASDSHYHHGNTSLESSIVSMAQRFKNSIPLLDSIGQFGSLRSPEAGAPRYISTKLSSSFKLLYKDNNLLTYREDEGETIEPYYFLPIVPTVILNGLSGIAVGFSSNILNRNPLDVIEACINYLKGKPINELKPWNREFFGEFTRDETNPNTWKIKGHCEILNTTTVKISEIPIHFSYEKYENLLNDLIENKDIVSYEDNSTDKIEYIVKFQRSVLAKHTTDTLYSLFKLNSRETETLTTLDERGEIKIFERAEDIVSYFVDFRLKYYEKRKRLIIEDLNHKIERNSEKARFIKYIIEEKIHINNIPKSKVEESLIKFEFKKQNDSYEYLLGMPIYSLTKEKYNELLNLIEIYKKELKEIENTTEKQLYLKDLYELRKSVKNML